MSQCLSRAEVTVVLSKRMSCFVLTSNARSMSSRVWAAEIQSLVRAAIKGTAGKPTTTTASFFSKQSRLTEAIFAGWYSIKGCKGHTDYYLYLTEKHIKYRVLKNAFLIHSCHLHDRSDSGWTRVSSKSPRSPLTKEERRCLKFNASRHW